MVLKQEKWGWLNRTWHYNTTKSLYRAWRESHSLKWLKWNHMKEPEQIKTPPTPNRSAAFSEYFIHSVAIICSLQRPLKHELSHSLRCSLYRRCLVWVHIWTFLYETHSEQWYSVTLSSKSYELIYKIIRSKISFVSSPQSPSPIGESISAWGS